MIYYLILGVTLRLINAEKYYQIEDIPIENFDFEHDDVQNNHMDIELMPRFQRSFPIYEDDPKEYFFRTTRSDYEDKHFDDVKDVPRPGGFNSYNENKEGKNNVRNKREAVESTSLKHDGRERKSIMRRLGKPLELAVIDPESITEGPDEISTDLSIIDKTSETNNFLINDFIRFKRATATERMPDDVLNLKNLMKKLEDENSSKTNNSTQDPKSFVEDVPQPYTEKLIMESRNDDKDTQRETRGATKDQWVKQMYPVRRNEEHEDNTPSSTEHENENIRAPRVHFVTQGMSESALRPEYNRYDREARARSLNKELSNDRYMNYDRREPWDDYTSRSRYYDYPERSHDSYNNYNNYSGSKGRQRRIIYYATLPDISRTPPNVDLRDRYQYRDRYEDRYFSPEPSYQLRKPYTKPRFGENENRKPTYPL
ncbi:hypothetical protein NQ314_020280, partial [Rhamnusium bicolor]